MTRSEILSELYRRTNYSSSPASEVTTRLASFVNLTHRQLLTQPGLNKLRDDLTTFASVSGTKEYALPQALAKIKHITDRTNQIPLREMSLAELRDGDPGLTSAGGPSTHYIRLGLRQVAQHPSDASQIFVKSTSASDTGTAYIEAVRTGGYRVSLSVSMTGTTAVSLGAAYTDIIEIDKFYLSAAAAAGTVTLHEDSGAGTELARIPIGATFARYEWIQLWPTPNSAITYHLDYTRKIYDLTNANDEPLLPEDFHYLLVEGALIKEWTKKDDDRRKAAEKDFEEGKRNLRSWVMSNADTLVSLRPTSPHWSQLGGYFPAGS
jgi:hypothetical protein